jgi:hypothetical protein
VCETNNLLKITKESKMFSSTSGLPGESIDDMEDKSSCFNHPDNLEFKPVKLEGRGLSSTIGMRMLLFTDLRNV